MNDPDGHFGESVAAAYDESSLQERWSGWQREPFTSDSDRHVSVWEKPGELEDR